MKFCSLLVLFGSAGSVLGFAPAAPSILQQKRQQQRVILGSTLSPTSTKSTEPAGDDGDQDIDEMLNRLAGSISSSLRSSSPGNNKTTKKRVKISQPFLGQSTHHNGVVDVATSNHTTTAADPAPLPYGPISMSISELASKLGGRGRARLAWDCYSIGVDPANFYDKVIRLGHPSEVFETIYEQLPSSRRTQRLGPKTLQALAGLYRERSTASTTSNNKNQTTIVNQLEGGVARLSHVKTSRDRTTKLLLQLADGLQVETVIIPWNNVRSTLCISSQVGCRQACRFCATGKMGLIRNLNSDEILAQMFWARKLCRLHDLPPVTNVVFMGMGDGSDNAEAVSRAAEILTTRELFQLSATKVTISTVAPTPESFQLFGSTPAVLAWSVHAARDELRKELVPTTQYSMDELCQGLIDTLNQRPMNFRTTMLEVVLIDQVNDNIDTDGKALVELSRKIVDGVPGCKLVVNLIPFNEIDTATKDLKKPLPSSVRAYKTPSAERVKTFQKYLWDNGVYAHVRQTRGDDESAACGQLATAKQQEQQQ